MITTEDIADLTLHHLGRTKYQPYLVVIGAMDGVSYDDLQGYIRAYRWSGLFVEPIPEQFRRLQKYHATLTDAPPHKYENSAVATHDGTIRMLTINQAAVDQGDVPASYGGMSAIVPPRNGLASAADADTVARYGETIDVPCVTLATLFARHAIDRVDVLCVDAEGWDWEILQQFDFGAYRPKLIRCEFVNLTPDAKAAIVERLERHDYVIRIEGQNIDGVTAEYWREVDAARPSPTAPLVREARSRTVMLVTGVFDPFKGHTDLRFRRAFGRYVDRLKRLLQVDWPMIVFTAPEFAEMVRRSRPGAPTFILERSLDDPKVFPFLRRLQTLRQQRTGPDPTPALSKALFLNDATVYDPFKTEGFLWVDGDIAASIGDPVSRFTDECRRALSARLATDRMMYTASPIEPVTEAPGFSRAAIAAFTTEDTAHLVRGRLFGGTRQAINAMNGAYYSYLGATLEAGHLGTEEQVLTVISYTHRHLCQVEMLSRQRPWHTFFDRLQREATAEADGASATA